MLYIYCWRIIYGFFEYVTYFFFVVGYIKFSFDWCFGFFKQKVRRIFVLLLFDIVEVIDKLILIGVNYGKFVGLYNGIVLVKIYDWVLYFGRYLRKINGVSKFYYFCFFKDYFRNVFCYELVDFFEKEFELFKNRNDFSLSILFFQVVFGGLDEERKSYLFRKIRQFCRLGIENFVVSVLGDFQIVFYILFKLSVRNWQLFV